jgi:dihydropteroate synthase
MIFPPRLPYTIPLPGRAPLELGDRTVVMGILNVTPDSFADGGLFLDVERAVAHACEMVEQGAEIVDVGGESTRPGAAPVGSEDQELARVLPVVERLANRLTVPISVDTYKSRVAREAVRRGATIVNDVSGLQYDPGLAQVAAETGAALVLMHNRGRSKDMYREAVYADVMAEVTEELTAAVHRALDAGVNRAAIILDPGLGFAKRAEHTYEAIARLDRLAVLDRPILSGPSRKSYLKTALGDHPAAERDWGTAAAVTASILQGAHIVRVHDVRGMVDVARVADRIRAGGSRAVGPTFRSGVC